MDLVHEMAKAIVEGSHGFATQEQAANGSALACLPVMEKWLREHKDLHAETLADELAAMARKAQP